MLLRDPRGTVFLIVQRVQARRKRGPAQTADVVKRGEKPAAPFAVSQQAAARLNAESDVFKAVIPDFGAFGDSDKLRAPQNESRRGNGKAAAVADRDHLPSDDCGFRDLSPRRNTKTRTRQESQLGEV